MQRFQQTKHALGSTAYLTLVLADDVPANPIFAMLWQYIDTFEARFSRFLPDSELSQFNNATGARRPVTSDFRRLLTTAKRMAEVTDGLYNPCILPALQRAGYRGSWPQPQHGDASLNYETRSVADWQQITINDNWVRIPHNAALDFGGIGKGYLLDCLSERLQTDEIANYWLSLGGDIRCAGHDVDKNPWHITIQNALDENKTVGAVKNDGHVLAVATSGTLKRRGISEAGPWHHIIDPRSNRPARTDVLAATVCASEATYADVAAKCLVIAGSDSAETLLHQLRATYALLQVVDGNSSRVVKLGAL